MKRLVIRPLLAGLLAGLAVLAVLPWPARGAAPLTIAAASSLQLALRDVQEAYESRTGTPTVLVFSASGSLARQIENGAPYDVFASANRAWMARLVERGLVARDSLAPYAQGVLALAVRERARLAHAPPEIDAQGLARLDDPALRVIALANPELAPYGQAARQALRHAGLWARLRERLVFANNVRQALTYVETGNADAGLVAAALLGESALAWRPVASALHRPIRQVAGVVAASPRPEQARAFVAFLAGPRGRTILRRHGFRPPPAP